MAQRKSANPPSVWLGQDSATHEAFGDGKLWIGRHTGDQDILVFDPAESDPSASVLSLYSLTQHRMRSFPRATVIQRIEELDDQVGAARARKEYLERDSLKAAHEQTLADAKTERMNVQRNDVIGVHQVYIEALGRTYEGVRDTPADHRPGRRTKCHNCGIVLDDFAGAVCGICDGVLCSCGVCACKKTVSSD